MTSDSRDSGFGVRGSGFGIQAARWLISGRVQGVGFRWFTVRAAEKAQVRGWVSNLPDGSVEVVAAGPEENLAQFEAAIRAGPRLGRVDSVDKFTIPHDTVSVNSFVVK